MTEQLDALTNYGAGIVALVLIFGIVWVVIKDFVPTLKEMGDTLSTTVDALGTSINVLNKTMIELQKSSTASIVLLEKKISTMETKLDYHITSAQKMERQLENVFSNTTEIKERVRGCNLVRGFDSYSRKEDLK